VLALVAEHVVEESLLLLFAQRVLPSASPGLDRRGSAPSRRGSLREGQSRRGTFGYLGLKKANRAGSGTYGVGADLVDLKFRLVSVRPSRVRPGIVLRMSGGHGDRYRIVGPQDGRPAAIRLVAAALLVVLAALAVGGSFGAFAIWEIAGGTDPAGGSTMFENGWQRSADPPPSVPQDNAQHGISLTIGALLGVAAAIMLVLTARRAGDPAAPRLAGVGAAAFLLGSIGAVWLDVAAFLRVAAALERTTNERGPTTLDTDFGVGIGAWLLLLAAIIALVAIGLLMTPRRTTPADAPGIGGGHATPYGSHYYGAPPVYAPGTAGAPGPPSPAGSPPGWAPPDGPRPG
jgi:hypothetical protein